MVQDPEATSGIYQALERHSITAETALANVFDMFAKLFASMDNELMNQRSHDLIDIKTRLLEILTNKNSLAMENIDDCIIICHGLRPSHIGRINIQKIKGIVTEIGGATSHSAIIAKSMEIPTILRVENITQNVKTGDIIALDGERGLVFVNPTSYCLEELSKLKREYRQNKQMLEIYKDKPGITLDGHTVVLAANIGSLAELDSAIKSSAEAIGLFRSEFLFTDKDKLPSEQEQFNVYKTMVRRMEGKPVI